MSSEPRREAIEAVDEHTAVIYLIPLATRTEMLVGLELRV